MDDAQRTMNDERSTMNQEHTNQERKSSLTPHGLWFMLDC